MNPEKASQGSSSFKVEAGVYEVTGAKFAVMKGDFADSVAALHFVLETAVCDKDGDRVKGADPVEIDFGYGKTSLEAFHPADAKSAGDEDPKDLGDRVGTEGNSIYCSGSEAFNKSCGAVVFTESLVKLGFPKDVLDQTYAPNYVGMKFRLDTLDSKTINEKYGTRLNTKPIVNSKGESNPVTYKIATAWLNPTYLSGAKASVPSKGKAPAAAEVTAVPASSKSDQELVMDCLVKIAAERQGEKGVVKSPTQLNGLITNAWTKGKMPSDRLKGMQTWIKGDGAAWLKSAVEKVGGVMGTEPTYVLFGVPADEDEAEVEYDEDGNPIE
jgi:hypothetical protein